MWRKWLLFAVLIIVAAGVWWRVGRPATYREFTRFSLNGQEFSAVVARRPEDISLGLSGRDSIGADAMLFLLPQAGRSSFWMYQMKFPLDFIWIAQGRVIDLHQDIPAPVPFNSADIATVSPSIPAEAVLEVPAGFIRQHNIATGAAFVLLGSFESKIW